MVGPGEPWAPGVRGGFGAISKVPNYGVGFETLSPDLAVTSFYAIWDNPIRWVGGRRSVPAQLGLMGFDGLNPSYGGIIGGTGNGGQVNLLNNCME